MGMQMMQMFKGMEMDLAVQVKGKVVKSNAMHVEGENKDRIVLMAIKFDDLLKSPEFQKMVSKSGAPESAGAFLSIPGVKMETNKQVVVEFKP